MSGISALGSFINTHLQTSFSYLTRDSRQCLFSLGSSRGSEHVTYRCVFLCTFDSNLMTVVWLFTKSLLVKALWPLFKFLCTYLQKHAACFINMSTGFASSENICKAVFFFPSKFQTSILNWLQNSPLLHVTASLYFSRHHRHQYKWNNEKQLAGICIMQIYMTNKTVTHSKTLNRVALLKSDQTPTQSWWSRMLLNLRNKDVILQCTTSVY